MVTSAGCYNLMKLLTDKAEQIGLGQHRDLTVHDANYLKRLGEQNFTGTLLWKARPSWGTHMAELSTDHIQHWRLKHQALIVAKNIAWEVPGDAVLMKVHVLGYDRIGQAKGRLLELVEREAALQEIDEAISALPPLEPHKLETSLTVQCADHYASVKQQAEDMGIWIRLTEKLDSILQQYCYWDEVEMKLHYHGGMNFGLTVCRRMQGDEWSADPLFRAIIFYPDQQIWCSHT
ncbi:MAG TPA: hypothetical protein V6D07_18540 [Trichocoleus sp.]